MKRQQLMTEVKEGECPECGLIGPLMSIRNRYLCDDCVLDFQELD